MEEEKAAAYYDELSRKGEGAAKFKQGLGFSAASNSNDAVPSRGSALPSASSFLSNFVRASSPSKNAELDKQAQLQSIQNKLKKKPREEDKTVSSSSRVSKDRDSGDHSRRRSRSRSRDRHSHRKNRSRSRERHSKHRSRSKDRGRDRHSRRRSRSRSRSRDDYSPKRRYRSRSTSRDRGSRERRSTKRSSSRSDEERDRRKNRSVDRRSEKVGKSRNSGADYATVIEGYDKMTPAERVKAKMILQLSETAERDESKGGMSSGWERFDFDKDAPLDDEEIEAAEDDAAIVKRIGHTFRFSSMEARREEQIKAAHDEAIFGALHPPPPPSHEETIYGTSSHPPFTERDDEIEAKSVKTSTNESAPLTSLISDQVRTMQQGSWRDRARKA